MLLDRRKKVTKEGVGKSDKIEKNETQITQI